jgi:hypothetical protein
MSNEPVAWITKWSCDGSRGAVLDYKKERHYGDVEHIPLYTHPVDDTALLRQALSTLEGWANHGDWVWPESALEQAKRNTEETITALRERLGEKT